MLRLLVLLLTLLPLATLSDPLHLRVQGSNTIGAALIPALVQGQLRAQQATAIAQQPGKVANERVITARDVHGQPLRIDIAAHGSSTALSRWAVARLTWPPPRDRSTTVKCASCRRWATCAQPAQNK